MRKMLWVTIVIGSLLLMGAMVAPEKSPQPNFPQVHGMGSMMGMGMMGKGGQMGQMGSMMPMTEGMLRMMDACARMMGSSSATPQEGNK